MTASRCFQRFEWFWLDLPVGLATLAKMSKHTWLALVVLTLAGVGCVANKSEDQLIRSLWGQTEKTIASMGRPERLYKIERARTALLVIDMQNGFCLPGACIEIPDGRKIVPQINALAAACRRVGVPVYWIRLNNSSEKPNEGLWPLFQPRSPVAADRPAPPEEFRDSKSATEVFGALQVDQLLDLQLPKNRYSAFINGSSGLEALLREAGRDTVIISGVGTDVCCESTARDAMMLDFKVVFVSDANATVNRFFHETALMRIKMFFGDVVSTEQVLHDLR